MFHNYIVQAWRHIRKQKLFSFVNILGMAVGMAGFILLAQISGTKLNADKFHDNAGRIYGFVQVVSPPDEREQHTAYAPLPVLAALENEFPEIENGTRILPGGRLILKRGDDAFYEDRILFVDPAFLSIFTFAMASGGHHEALRDPRSIVLTETMARKYFGKEDPLGKTLILGNAVDLTVTGVAEDLPRTSTLRFDFLVPIETARPFVEGFDDWRTDRASVFLLLGKQPHLSGLAGKFPSFAEKYFADSPETKKAFYLLPFLDFRLDANHIATFLPTSPRAAVLLPFFLGVLLLLVVSFNFINLSNARHMHRLREIGLRKTIGARRSQIVTQLLGESLLLAFLALPLAVLFYELIHPVFYTYMLQAVPRGIASSVSNSIWNYPYLLKYLVVAALLTGFFSGFYPAFSLSACHPALILKGTIQTGRKKRRGGKFMIVAQFTLAVLFITSSAVIKKQFEHWVDADFGFSRDNLAIIRLPEEILPNLDSLKTEISRHPGVLTVSASANLPLVWSENRPARAAEANPEEAIVVDAYGVDYEFIEALDMTIKAGRSFSLAHGDSGNFIVNEAAVKQFAWTDPVGRLLTVGDRTGTVVGVVKDFLFDDIGFQIPPAVLFVEQERLNTLLVKHVPGSFPDVRDFTRERWKAFAPDLPFTCTTFEEEFHAFFDLVDRLAVFVIGLGLATVFFSCLGLLGLAIFLLERRTKEIGIRKVLGASLARITWGITREYLLLVGIANILGAGLIFFGWRKTMQTGLLYLQNIGPGPVILSLSISLAAALAAVLSQSLKAARANPVDSLKSE